MYATPITLYQNIDNPLQFVFRDLDQKRVSIEGYQLFLNIITANSATVNQVVRTSTSVIAYADGGSAEVPVTNGTSNISPIIAIPMTVLDTGVDAKTRGLATVIIPQSTLANMCPDDYWYSIKAVAQNGQSLPTFVDGNSNARGTLKLIGGIF